MTVRCPFEHGPQTISIPSYPSNHGSASNSAAEVLKRVYGAGGHAITMATPAVPRVTLHYTRFNQITDDISDARSYGGIHFRFDRRPAPISATTKHKENTVQILTFVPFVSLVVTERRAPHPSATLRILE